MASPLLLVLILIAASTQNGFTPGMSLPNIDISEIIANLPDIIANLPNIIANIDWSEVLQAIQNVIQNLPTLIDNLPEIIGNLPIDLPEIIGNIIDRLPEIIAALPADLREVIANIIANFPDILDRLPEIIGAIPDIVNLPDVVASLSDLLNRIRDFVGATDWDQIVAALPELDDVVAAIPDIIANLPDIINNLPDIIDRLPEIVSNLPVDWAAILDSFPTIERDVGVPSSIQEFPSLIQVEIGYNNLWVQGCTASILNAGYAVSSARCFSGRLYHTSLRRLKAGANIRGGDGTIYGVSYAVNHPTFGSNGFDGDLSVVRVVGVIFYGPNVQPVGITSQGVFFPAGVLLTTAGWGSTAQGRNIANRNLHKTELFVVDNQQCADMYYRFPVTITVTHNMICAGRPQSGGRMADLRDAGGPLYYQNTLVGILSFGRYVGNDSMPVVATSVSSYTNWIVNTAV